MLNKCTKMAPRGKITAEYSIKAETETKEHETPWTKHKREVKEEILLAAYRTTRKTEKRYKRE